jgi:hypothetical protein
MITSAVQKYIVLVLAESVPYRYTYGWSGPPSIDISYVRGTDNKYIGIGPAAKSNILVLDFQYIAYGNILPNILNFQKFLPRVERISELMNAVWKI